MLVIKNAIVVTQNAKREVLRADVGIDGNTIAKVGWIRTEKYDEIVDGSNKILMPGLVNTHTHVAMALLRGYADDMELHKWLTEKIWPTEAKLRPDDIYWGSLLGCVEMIRAGATGFCDMYFYVEETARAVEKIGMRARLSKVFFDTEALDTSPEKAFSFEGKNTNLVMYDIGPHAPYTVSKENLLKAKEYAEEKNCLVHIHVAETRKEIFDIKKKYGKRVVEYLDDIGFLSDRVLAAHCNWITRKEASILAKRGVKVSHTPVSGMKLATGGTAPVPDLIDDGCIVSLGTDGPCSNNSLNILETMKTATLIAKFTRWNPELITAQQALDMATISGARTMGINSGCIEAGRLADIIMLDATSPNLKPAHNIISNIVYSACAHDVTDVIVGGRFLMRDRKILTVEEPRVIAKAEKVAYELINR